MPIYGVIRLRIDPHDVRQAPPRKPLHYDAKRRRLWIRGQRCHHGATGALLAGAGLVGLAAQARAGGRRASSPRAVC